ncbi:MAG TPA: hypothetical protein VF720_08675 [Candidatus Eisenbacteria bacterium]
MRTTNSHLCGRPLRYIPPILIMGLLMLSSPGRTDETAVTGVSAQSAATGVSTEARPIVDALYVAMGGRLAMDALADLRFTFTYTSNDTLRSSRTHWWDRANGRYRIQGKSRTGEEYVILFNTNTQEGTAWVEGKLQEGESQARWLKRGYGTFINDMYWLLMPFKLDDPGVTVVTDGEADVAGAHCDRLKVTFDRVGLTPGDTYWAYVDRANHRMIRWGFILQDDAGPNATESLWDWTEWREVAGVLVAPARVAVADPDRTVIRFENLEGGVGWPDSVFTSTAPIQL